MNVTNLVPNISSPPLANFVSEPKALEQSILLVEDDGALRRYLQIVLERAGFSVVTAKDGIDAQSKISSDSFIAIISDGMMPRMSGYELCRYVRQNEKCSQTPFVLLSGLEQEDYITKLNEKADLYLSKPVSPNDLVSHLERLLPSAA